MPILSKTIIFLMGLRLVLNQFRDLTFFAIGQYNVSILTIWSAVFTTLVIVRLMAPPPLRKDLKVVVIVLIFYMTVFGITRVFAPAEIITSYLYTLQFFLSLLVAGKVLDDIPLDTAVSTITVFGGLLLAMHFTAVVWSGQSGFDEDLGGYIGAFPTKQIAGESFTALFPFVFQRYLMKRDVSRFVLLGSTVVALFFTFQRTSIIAALVVVAVYFVYTKKYRYILVALVLFAVLIAVLPQDRIDTFLESKVTGELQAAEQGDIGAIGAGRMAIVLLAAEWLLDKMSIFQILFGLGTAQSNMLHILAIGYYAYAHVQLVALVIDYGLIGTLLFITVFQRIFVQKSRQLAEDPSVTNIISISVLVMVLSKFFYAMPLQDGATSALVVFWLGALR